MDLTELFVFVDDVCQEHRHTWLQQQKMIGPYAHFDVKTRNRKSRMSDSEICTILIEFSWCLTPGNVDDRKPMDVLTKDLFGKLYADKGYISQELFERLFLRNIELITKVKKNMQNRLISEFDKCMLRKRSLVETVNDQLQNISMIEHTRHRSMWNFLNNIVCALIAYCLQPKKLSLTTQIMIEDQDVVVV